MRIVSLLFHDVYAADPRESGFVSAAADRYKLSVSRFDAQLAGIEAVRRDAPLCVADTSDVSTDCASDLPFAITVDDGGASYRSVVADRLEARGWRGHCFVATDWIGRSGFVTAADLRDLDARGHIVGSHSASHPTRFSACSARRMLAEWRRSRAVLEDLLGHAVQTASVPGGYFSSTVARAAAAAGVRVLFTSEPTITVRAVDECQIVGRYAVRAGCPADFCGRLVSPPPRARTAAWASWNVKKLVKPLLGSAYSRLADWIVEIGN